MKFQVKVIKDAYDLSDAKINVTVTDGAQEYGTLIGFTEMAKYKGMKMPEFLPYLTKNMCTESFRQELSDFINVTEQRVFIRNNEQEALKNFWRGINSFFNHQRA
jgi:hypothetical protein